jgi:hypothetical protein
VVIAAVAVLRSEAPHGFGFGWAAGWGQWLTALVFGILGFYFWRLVIKEEA